ncbi:hypothetical protein FA13DRAFT_1293316 [Coprinellus micaceus]|uniref:Uncharacterized protein n=1 Tax=Coprinellus micaceus TaxID=71717 RepID=A0A4Y7SSB2_COPMI|nr:hypothetical protein FA13DRAFT_1293316 [Coprinellus micaceus]
MCGNTNTAGVYPPSRISGPLSGIRASHVCSRWRRIALATPLSWNHLFLVSWSALIRVEEYLERSRGYPLNLWMDLLAGTAKQRKPERFRHCVVLPLPVPHLHRIRRLFRMTQDDNALQDLSAASMRTPTATLVQTIRAGAWNPWSEYIESRSAHVGLDPNYLRCSPRTTTLLCVPRSMQHPLSSTTFGSEGPFTCGLGVNASLRERRTTFRKLYLELHNRPPVPPNFGTVCVVLQL